MPPRAAILAAVLLSLATGPVAAGAVEPAATAGGAPVSTSRLLWATVNVCDTARHPDTVGVRASMPGVGNPRERMYMRFRVQYFSPRDGNWHRIRQGGDSGFVAVGSARYRSRQAGRSFRFAPRAGSVLLRGVVSFEWRRGGKVVRRESERTRAPHRSSAGADPRGYTASNCTIRA